MSWLNAISFEFHLEHFENVFGEGLQAEESRRREGCGSKIDYKFGEQQQKIT